MNTKIFVMTHKRIMEIKDPMYVLMQVGKAGKEDFGYLGDDTGDHISEKNDRYCELTGMYWIWKNMDCDIVGICHYRRFFVKNEALMDQRYIEKQLEKYDIIVPSTRFLQEKNIYENYKLNHYSKDLDMCREVIAQKYPGYVNAFDFAMKTPAFSIGNMWITRKEIYDNYCSWLFDILFEVEQRIDVTDYDPYQKRVFGFLSEWLFRVWLLMQSFSVKEEQIKMITPDDFDNAEKKMELLGNLVKIKINPVLALHENGNVSESLVFPFICEDDFEGKIPVWVCWWQGEADMTEMIRLCYDSLKQNLPGNKTALRLITLENCMKYVTFTEAVIRKYNEGKITPTHLSDILRAELLYRYGGMWIDATYYVASAIPESLLDMDLFTLRFKETMWKADITKGRWSGNLWITKKGGKLFQYWLECFWYYWETNEELADYFLTDYIIAAILEKFPDIRGELDHCIYSDPAVYELQEMLNQKCSKERMEYMGKASTFYKLNRREEYRKENIAGEPTLYGALCRVYHQNNNGSLPDKK